MVVLESSHENLILAVVIEWSTHNSPIKSVIAQNTCNYKSLLDIPHKLVQLHRL